MGVKAEFKSLRTLSNGPIKSVESLYEELREVAYNVTNVWSQRFNTTTMYRMRLPGLVKVIMSGHNASEEKTFLVHRFLLEDTGLTLKELVDPLNYTGITSTSISAEAHTHHATVNFEHILLLLKLRWLLKLHSALCELDHKVCSLKTFITSLHRLCLQQSKQAPKDHGFSVKLLPQLLNVNSLVDDLIEQLMRNMGQGFGGFVHFVQSCDSKRALYFSATDFGPAKVHSNSYLTEMLDDIFMSHFLRLPANKHKVIDLFSDLDAFSISLPDVYVLQLDYIKWWNNSTSDRSKCAREKSAQLQALRAIIAVEMEELGNHATNDNEDGARAEFTTEALEILSVIVGSHTTFPDGFRARLVEILMTRYNIPEKFRRSIKVLTQTNLDLPKLTAGQMTAVVSSELERRHDRNESLFDNDLTCLMPALVPSPTKSGEKAEYMKEVTCGLARSTSVPYLASTCRQEKFRVPLSTGPLSFDPLLNTMRTTGFFQYMETLGP